MNDGYTSSGCIICGRDNPIGLHTLFKPTQTGVSAEISPGRNFQGFDGLLQGGIIAGLLDDAMWWALHARGHITLTAELSVRYKAPVRVETHLFVTGSVIEQRRSVFVCRAQMHDENGVVLAESTGKFMRAPSDVGQAMSEQTRKSSNETGGSAD